MWSEPFNPQSNPPGGLCCTTSAYFATLRVAQRNDDGFIENLAKQGIAYVPFFPLGGFRRLQSSAQDAAAKSLQASIAKLITMIAGTASKGRSLSSATVKKPGP